MQTTFIIKEDDEKNNIIGGIDSTRLESIVEKIERLEESKKAILLDIRDIYAEAKGVGFDVKIIRKIIKLRSMNACDRDEQDFILETYRKALNIWIAS